MKYVICIAAVACLVGCARHPSPEDPTPSAVAPHPAAFHSVVVPVRNPESGMCSLAASRSLLDAEHYFCFGSLWKYDPEQRRWSQVGRNLSGSAEILPLDTKGPLSTVVYQLLIVLTDEMGLFWAWYEEDGKRRGTLV